MSFIINLCSINKQNKQTNSTPNGLLVNTVLNIYINYGRNVILRRCSGLFLCLGICYSFLILLLNVSHKIYTWGYSFLSPFLPAFLPSSLPFFFCFFFLSSFILSFFFPFDIVKESSLSIFSN